MDLKDIKAIIDLMRKNSISEFELERQDFKIRLKRVNASSQMDDVPHQSYVTESASRVPTGVQLPPPAVSIAIAAAEVEIKSPMVGTFYLSPSPEAGNYVEIGGEVNVETVVCVIEAMKVMNEIKAEVKGIITQVLVDNAKPVEFGQPLFKIRPL